MASPTQKTAEGTETTQMRQLADMVHNFNKAAAGVFNEVGKMLDNPSSSAIPNTTSKAMEDYYASYMKLTRFAESHVPLLKRMLELSLSDRVNLDGKQIGIQNDDKKALQLIDDMKGVYSVGCGFGPSGFPTSLPKMTVVLKNKTGETPLFSFYDGGPEASEKTAHLAFYPSEEIYKMVAKSPLSSVPKKSE